MKWTFAIVCVLACEVSLVDLLRTFEAGAPNAIPFRIAYATTAILCLMGSTLPFVSSKAEYQ